MTDYRVIDLRDGEVYSAFAENKEEALKIVIDDHFPEWNAEGWVEGEHMYEGVGYDQFIVVPDRYAKPFQPTSKSFNE